MPPDEMPERLTATHLVGLEVVIGGRHYRQRCSWCGIELVDVDVTMIGVPEGQDPTPPFWEVGALVRTSNLGGGVKSTEVVEPDVRDGETQSPADACWAMYLPGAEVPTKPH